LVVALLAIVLEFKREYKQLSVIVSEEKLMEGVTGEALQILY
jgi:hypothetical protein